MKLLILLFVSLPAIAAVKFSHERSTGLGFDQVALIEEAGTTVVKKTSNWFDVKEDYRLGRFVVTSGKDLAGVKAELAEIEQQLTVAEERLAASGTSFNDLNHNRAPHAPYFKVGEFKVIEGSVLYPRLVELSQRIEALSLSLVDGVELDKTRKFYVFYSNGKEVNREPFNARFFCEIPRFPTRCLARQWGALYLE